MTTEIVTTDGEVIEEQRAPMTLFGTDNPEQVVERASSIATALAKVINERGLTSRIRDKDHVQVEGWTLLGSMLGVFAEIEWSREVEIEGKAGWEARAVARTLAGQIVGAAEAMCTRREGRWSSADAYAIRSMAQTRAVSKALRLPLGFIMHLAGYSATPAEELADEQPGQGSAVPSGTAKPDERDGATTPAPAPAPTTYRRGELHDLMVEKELTPEHLLDYAKLLGIPDSERPMSNESVDRLIEAVRGHGTDAVIEQPAAEVPSAPADPPRPGTDEYKALPVGDKAKARAYWAEKDAEDRKPPINPEQETLPIEVAS